MGGAGYGFAQAALLASGSATNVMLSVPFGEDALRHFMFLERPRG
jgi:hypothetical protein